MWPPTPVRDRRRHGRLGRLIIVLGLLCLGITFYKLQSENYAFTDLQHVSGLERRKLSRGVHGASQRHEVAAISSNTQNSIASELLLPSNGYMKVEVSAEDSGEGDGGHAAASTSALRGFPGKVPRPVYRAADPQSELDAVAVLGGTAGSELGITSEDLQRHKAPSKPASTRKAVDPSRYLRRSAVPEFEKQKSRVAEYLDSQEFKEHQQSLSSATPRCILVNAGGKRLLSSFMVLMKVLRETLHCTLPVYLAWHGADEMDSSTLKQLLSTFTGLQHFDVTAMPYPPHHRRQKQVNLQRFEGKVYSLLHVPCREVLLLDADNVPLVDPSRLFELSEFAAHGNLFWSDFWSSGVQEGLFDVLGVELMQFREALRQGKGKGRHNAESGALLLDRQRHADMIEMAFLINSFADITYELMWGDKDSFAFAFALAGKAHLYSQNTVPPGGLFKWRKDMLLTKATRERSWGFQLLGMIQFDPMGAPTFMHRTINKFDIDCEEWHIDLATGPLSHRWVAYYLDHQSLGPTKGVPWDYVAPQTAFKVWNLNPPGAWAYAEGNRWAHEEVIGCPLATFFDYRWMREEGLPIGQLPDLEARCAGVLPRVMGRGPYLEALANGTIDHPETKRLDIRYTDGEVRLPGSGREVGDATPTAAWRPAYDPPTWDGPVPGAIRAAYHALSWVRANKRLFPVLTAQHKERKPEKGG